MVFFFVLLKTSQFENSNGDRPYFYLLIQGTNCFKWINMEMFKSYHKNYFILFHFICRFKDKDGRDFYFSMLCGNENLGIHCKIQLIVLSFLIASRKFSVLKHDTHTR